MKRAQGTVSGTTARLPRFRKRSFAKAPTALPRFSRDVSRCFFPRPERAPIQNPCPSRPGTSPVNPDQAAGRGCAGMTPDCFFHPQKPRLPISCRVRRTRQEGAGSIFSSLWMNAARVSTKVSRLPRPKPALWGVEVSRGGRFRSSFVHGRTVFSLLAENWPRDRPPGGASLPLL